jgi:3-hydroxyanthranilate 3,4-dioxygenase
VFTPLNLEQWVQDHRHLLQPPVGNKAVWVDERETIVMIVGGPNARNDYHVQDTEEFFYQVEGDIILRVIDPETGKPKDIVLREGEIYLLPKGVPHSPQRSAGTVGLVIEQRRPEGSPDRLRWYCDACFAQVHEASFMLRNIATDLKRIMEEFWSDDALRTCACGVKVEQPGEAQPPGSEA